MNRNLLNKLVLPPTLTILLLCLLSSHTFVEAATITGTLRASSVPVTGMSVTAYDTVSGSSIATSSVSDSNGVYSITGLSAGSYKIRVNPSGASGFIVQWYSGAMDYSLATAITVTTEETSSGKDFNLASGARTISGSVSVSVSGLGVNAYNTATGGFVRGATTASNGSYTIYGLSPGSYRLRFIGNSTYAYQYYNNTLDINLATPLIITSASLSDINFSVVQNGSITGTVTASSLPVQNITIHAYDAINGNHLGTDVVSNAGGNYSITSLPPGQYKVRFNGDITYAQQYYNGKPNTNEAIWVTVSEGTATPNINFSLTAGANIIGSVTSGSSGGGGCIL